MMRRDRLTFAVVLLFGSALGLGLFTFGYAKGYSYLGHDSAACANCHIMSEHYAAWMKGSHHSTATCNDCHTPFKMGPNGPAPDMTRALSGHPADMVMPPVPAMPAGPWIGAMSATNTAWAGPWGVSFTANLTPDKETGLGAWTKQNFVDTIRNGRHLGNGRPLLPPMPSPSLAMLTDDDLGAMFAYLQTLPPIANKVPAPIPPDASSSQVSTK